MEGYIRNDEAAGCPLERVKLEDSITAAQRVVESAGDFLEEHAPGFVKEYGFFEVLAFDSSRTLLTVEGCELFLLIAQAVITKEVLRKYADEARLQCD